MRAPTLQLLEWVRERPRTRTETLEVWRSSCPRLTVWEDALADGLVRVDGGLVVLTAAGERYGRRAGQDAGVGSPPV